MIDREHKIVPGELMVITARNVINDDNTIMRFRTRRVFEKLIKITALGYPVVHDGFDVMVPTTATVLSGLQDGWVYVLLNETGMRAWVAVAFLELL